MRSGEGRKTEAAGSPLAGKLFDEAGEPLYVQGAAKGQRRYRHYVSKTLVEITLACGRRATEPPHAKSFVIPGCVVVCPRNRRRRSGTVVFSTESNISSVTRTE
jgi:hypothetical protein